MTVDTHSIGAPAGEHVVQFYEEDGQLVDTVGPHLHAALEAGDVAIVIATEAHRRAFEEYLRGEGVDLDEAVAKEQLISLDAASVLGALTIAGEIREHAFRTVIGGLVRRSVESGRLVHAYGEMVALLWDEGKVPAAVELETMWNDLARELPFSLYCAYRSASVAGAEQADMLHRVCGLHSKVLDAPTERANAENAPLDGARAVDAATRSDGQAVTALRAHFPATLAAPGEARRLLVEALLSLRGGQRMCVDAAALVLSELASNAVRHADSAFTVLATIERSTLHLVVEDARRPSARRSMPVDRAHGLGVVDSLALRWGVEDTRAGKAVWADLPLRSS